MIDSQCTGQRREFYAGGVLQKANAELYGMETIARMFVEGDSLGTPYIQLTLQYPDGSQEVLRVQSYSIEGDVVTMQFLNGQRRVRVDQYFGHRQVGR